MADPELDKTLMATDAPARGRELITPGRLFAGRYLLEALLGEGGMGTVYRAHDREVDEQIALKLLRDGGSMGATLVERFRREVRLARRVTHRNVARTYDLGEHAGVRFLTMEYIRGESLQARLEREGRVGWREAARLCAEICAGLIAAHDVGVIHRDLKPANILIEAPGDARARVVITDFGIARGVGAGASLQTGAMMGTPAYMAPEQVAGLPVDHRADLYALGMILYELATGALPFEGESAIAVAIARLQRAPIDPRARVSGLPEPLALLILALLAREPEERPADARAVLDALTGLGAARPGPGATVLSSPDEPERHGHTTTSSSSASGARWAALDPGERALAVLPFRYRGAPESAYLAETLCDELIDLLSRTRGLRVTSSGATARYADTRGGERDPRAIGGELGVDMIVDATLQLAGARLRIAARLLDVASGFQLWSDRFEGGLEDIFELQDTMGHRITEALRVELQAIVHRGEAPAEAIELYLQARSALRSLWSAGARADPLALLDRCLELAPQFKPAIAARAFAAVQAWFSPDNDGRVNHEADARAAVDRALAEAPDLAESHYALARFAAQVGDFGETARALARTLQIAPTSAEAQRYLGRLQCEAGRSREGAKRIRLAMELDPSNTVGYFELCRERALRGDREGYDATLASFKATNRGDPVFINLLDARVGLWWGDAPRLERATDFLRRLPADDDRPIQALLAMWARDARGDRCQGEILELIGARVQNPRIATVWWQLLAESNAARGDDGDALEFIGRAASATLVDREWLELNPLFARLRERPEFLAAHERVSARANAIWAVRL
ncbi:MAG: protein kinase [Myxococcales bacterium]|nr:protein kinase [Myxococcales bacterium]